MWMFGWCSRFLGTSRLARRRIIQHWLRAGWQACGCDDTPGDVRTAAAEADMTADVLAFSIAFGVLATFVVAGCVLLFTELRRLGNKVEAQTGALNTKFDDLRRDLAEEFRAQ